MTFSSSPRPWVQLSVSKIQKYFLVLEYILTLNSSRGTNSGVHQNACRLRCSITPVYLTLSLPCHLQQLIYHTKLKFSVTFKDRQFNSMTFQTWKRKFLNSMTFPCRFSMICTNSDQHLEQEYNELDFLSTRPISNLINHNNSSLAIVITSEK